MFPMLIWGQKKEKKEKPAVLVYGHEADAFAAAIQSAQSGVETLWIIDSSAVGGNLIQGETKSINANDRLDVGSWAFFLMRLARVPAPSDSAFQITKQQLAPRLVQNIFEDLPDTVNRLSLRKNLCVTALEKSGKGWQVRLSNGEKIKIKALVDASIQHALWDLVPSEKGTNGTSPDSTQAISLQVNYEQTEYRMGIAVGQSGEHIYNVPFRQILPDSAPVNLFVTRKAFYPQIRLDQLALLPLLFQQGQACGAAAAYCALFDVPASQIPIRTLQRELLAYRGALIPFQDISLADPHHAAIQRIGATGLLTGSYEQQAAHTRFLFHPDSTVSYEEVAPILKALYTRSQIWFKDKPSGTFTLTSLMDLIKYVANRGNELDTEIEKGWKRRFQFEGPYSPDRVLTRREFAVLVDGYLHPFHVRIDNQGRFQY